jgi:hypothetical protein
MLSVADEENFIRFQLVNLSLNLWLLCSTAPEPVITRWGWLDATIYYCSHFQVVKNIADSLKMEDVKAIEAAQEHISCSKLEGQLAFCFQQKGAMLEDLITLLKKVAIN